jgi:hypothetical protein
MKNNLFVMLTICVVMICFLLSESSAVMHGLSTEELTRASDLVLEGVVEDVKAYWGRDRKTIFTRAVISDSYVIKGRLTQRHVEVEYEGGEIGDTGLSVSDVAPLRKGEKVILFLKAGKSMKDGHVFNIVGKGQGKYTIDRDGIARKGGFSVMGGDELIDNNIPSGELIERILRLK